MYCISWHTTKGFYITWLRDSIYEVVDVLRGWIPERAWCLDHVRDIILVYDYTHLYGTWLERHIMILGKEDVSTWCKYSLDTVTCYRSMWKKLQRVISFQEKGNPSFQKAYIGCIIVWSRTYACYITYRSRTYAFCNTTGRVPVVFLLIHV